MSAFPASATTRLRRRNGSQSGVVLPVLCWFPPAVFVPISASRRPVRADRVSVRAVRGPALAMLDAAALRLWFCSPCGE